LKLPNQPQTEATASSRLEAHAPQQVAVAWIHAASTSSLHHGVFAQPLCQVFLRRKIKQRFAKLLNLLDRQRANAFLRFGVYLAQPASYRDRSHR
jgi:hypothetical protein